MPVPSPKGKEEEQDFVSRCMSAIGGEYDQKQAAAICYDAWREAQKASVPSPTGTSLEEKLAVEMIRSALDYDPNRSEEFAKACDVWVNAHAGDYKNMLDTVDIKTVAKRAVDDFTHQFPEARGWAEALIQHMVVSLSKIA